MEEEGRRIRSDQAKREFRSVLNAVEHDGEHITILRYNTPAVVIVPVEWYQQARDKLSEEGDGEALQR